MIKKKIWLDYLFYELGKQRYDFRLSSLKKINDEIIPSKWKKYSELIFPIDINQEWKLKHINNREILPCELVIDLEDRSKYKDAIKKIKDDELKFYSFDTMSRGLHIHIFFNDELSVSEKVILIKRYGGDTQKAFCGSAIALEFAAHWKSGKIKNLIEKWK